MLICIAIYIYIYKQIPAVYAYMYKEQVSILIRFCCASTDSFAALPRARTFILEYLGLCKYMFARGRMSARGFEAITGTLAHSSSFLENQLTRLCLVCAQQQLLRQSRVS